MGENMLIRRDLLMAMAGAAAMPRAAWGQTTAQAATSGAIETPSREAPVSITSVDDCERQAAKILAPGPYALIKDGDGASWTVAENRAAFARQAILPGYLSGVSEPQLATTLLGIALAHPIMTAPMGNHGIAHRSAEIGSVRGTGAAKGLYTAATLSVFSLEDIAQAGGDTPKFFQLYMLNDRGFVAELLQRAKNAGYRAVVMTVDGSDYTMVEEPTRLKYRPSSARGNVGPLRDRLGGKPFMKLGLDWSDIEFVMKSSGLPVIIKGVLTPELALEAAKRGAAGIQVSNHGGRQVDGLPASITVLPGIADALAGRIPIILDSGVRRGQDVFKALAMGATCVAIGRPVLYGLAIGGRYGVEAVYAALLRELTAVMEIAGAKTISAISRKSFTSLS